MPVSPSMSSSVLRLSFSLFLTLSLFMLLDSRDTRQDHNKVRYNLYLVNFSFYTIITDLLLADITTHFPYLSTFFKGVSLFDFLYLTNI